MRKFSCCIHNTFITSDLFIGDLKTSSRRGFATQEAHDYAMCKALSTTPKGSTLVVLGNLFGAKMTKDPAEKIVDSITNGGKSLICLEGGMDSKLIRELSKSRKLDDGGDMSIICSGTSGATISFYPMMWWPKKECNYINIYGYAGTKSTKGFPTLGSIGCDLETLMAKTRKPVVSLQYLLESFQKGAGLWGV